MGASIKNVVLLSGGVESTYCAMLSSKKNRGEGCLHICFNYGQPYFEKEAKASLKISQVTGTPCVIHRIKNIPVDASGVFFERNSTLISIACTSFPDSRIWFGCRGILPVFDKFKDSNLVYAARISRQLGCKIRTPCILLPKALMKWRIKKWSRDAYNNMWSSEGYSYGGV